MLFSTFSRIYLLHPLKVCSPFSYKNLANPLELYQSTFQYLEYAILDHTPDSQLALLKFYNSLLRQWTVTFLSSTPPAMASNAIIALTTHANTLALTLLQNSPTTPTHQGILTFYETTAFLISRPTLQSHVRITIPPSELVYTLHFSSSLPTLSRLCAILAIYKRAFESAMAKPTTTGEGPAPQIESYPTAYVNLFNGFLMDICNCLWRSRAFNTSDTNALGCLLPPALLPALTTYVAKLDTGLALPSLFSLSYSPILCNLSISYVRELEDQAEEAAAKAGTTTEGGAAGKHVDTAEGGIQIRHAGPVTQRSLVQLGKDGGLKLSWPNYRLGVLRYLEGRGVMGVGELMYNTLKHLMSAREGAAAATKS
jgi:centromere protein I